MVDFATYRDVKKRFDEGDDGEQTHMIITTDDFHNNDHPVYVKKGEDVRQVYQHLKNEPMRKVMEVYSYSHSFEEQV